MAVAHTAQRSLVIERLCAHHIVGGFSSGSANYDRMIRVAAKAIATATENDQFFVAHHGDNAAIGFLAIGEMTVTRPGQPSAEGLLISGLAVDLSVQNPAVIRGLLKRAVMIRNARLRAKSYLFEAALVSQNERIDAVLERAGFSRYEDAFWIRPIR
jgi:hypothetical protein